MGGGVARFSLWSDKKNELWNVILNSRKSFLFFLKKRGYLLRDIWKTIRTSVDRALVWFSHWRSEHIHYEIWFFLHLFLRMRLGLGLCLGAILCIGPGLTPYGASGVFKITLENQRENWRSLRWERM